MNYFQVSGDRKLRASFGNGQVAALTDHFSSPLSNDEKGKCCFTVAGVKDLPLQSPNNETL